MKRFILLSVATMMLASCSNQIEQPQKDGTQDQELRSGVRIALSMDVAMNGLTSKSNGNTKGAYGSNLDLVVTFATTRATVEDNYPMKEEHFSAVIKQDDLVLHSFDKLSDIPSVLYLEPGNYSIAIATNGTRSQINELPMYQGETPFTVETGKVSAVNAKASIRSMAISVSFSGLVENLASYKMSYYHLSTPDKILMVVTEQQNTPHAKRVYMDTPFPYGIKIEGRMDGVRWVKNVLVYDDLSVQTYHNITVN